MQLLAVFKGLLERGERDGDCRHAFAAMYTLASVLGQYVLQRYAIQMIAEVVSRLRFADEEVRSRALRVLWRLRSGTRLSFPVLYQGCRLIDMIVSRCDESVTRELAVLSFIPQCAGLARVQEKVQAVGRCVSLGDQLERILPSLGNEVRLEQKLGHASDILGTHFDGLDGLVCSRSCSRSDKVE